MRTSVTWPAHLRPLVGALAVLLVLSGSGPVGARPAAPAEGSRAGSPGIGDPYFPLDGNGGIDVLHYSVHDAYDFEAARISGWTRLRIRATHALDTFNLDFLLPVRRVLVDGRAVPFSRERRHELVIDPPALRDGQRFTVRVDYAGRPGGRSYLGESNWLADDGEVVTMNQPHMAPWWFPANDHPLDKARHDFFITVPRGREVIANGLPRGRSSQGSQVTWHWRAADPMAPYLAFFAAGDFEVRRGVRDGLPWINAVSRALPAQPRQVAQRWLRRTPRITQWLESEIGPYPFEATGGLVTSLGVGFALENQTRPTYPYVGRADWLLVHELAHQWFGDSVAVDGWRDIWLNEGFATYYEARYAEVRGWSSVDEWLDRAYGERTATSSFWDVRVQDPGPRRIFDSAIYDRGAMTLAALRNVVGDAAFNRLVRTWAARHRDRNASTPQFRALAERIAGRDLDPFFDAWLVARAKPADTAAYGLGMTR